MKFLASPSSSFSSLSLTTPTPFHIFPPSPRFIRYNKQKVWRIHSSLKTRHVILSGLFISRYFPSSSPSCDSLLVPHHLLINQMWLALARTCKAKNKQPRDRRPKTRCCS
jgi:hypothetical protein